MAEEIYLLVQQSNLGIVDDWLARSYSSVLYRSWT